MVFQKLGKYDKYWGGTLPLRRRPGGVEMTLEDQESPPGAGPPGIPVIPDIPATPVEDAVLVEPIQSVNGKRPRDIKKRCEHMKRDHQTGSMVRCERPASKGRFCSSPSHGGNVKYDLDMKKQFRLGKLYNNHLKTIRKDRRAIYSMEQELAMSKSMVSMLRGELKRKGLDSEEENPKLDAGSLRLIKQISEAIESVVKVTERIYKIEQQEKQKFDAEAMGEIIGSISAIIKRRVTDEATLHEIGEDLNKLGENYA